jgi:hypothetical protein
MNATDPLNSFTNLDLSIYGAITLVAIFLLTLLYSNQIKRRWYDRIERKKWQQWNGPKGSGPTEPRDPPTKS